MRALVLLATLLLALILGIACGLAFSKPAKRSVAVVPVVQENTAAPEPATIAVLVSPVSRSVPVAMNPMPAPIREWRLEKRDEIVRLAEKLPRADADFLCLTLGLIPRDEVFDKVNVRGRLIRHINRVSTSAEFADLEAAFRQLDRERPRSGVLPPR